MLVLSRRLNEAVVIGNGIVVRIGKISGKRVRLAIDAPVDVSVDREEVHQRRLKEAAESPAALSCCDSRTVSARIIPSN